MIKIYVALHTCVVLTLPLCAAVRMLVVVMFRSLYGTEMRLESQFILPVIPKLNISLICK